MNVQVRDIAMGNHHTLVLGDDNTKSYLISLFDSDLKIK